MTRRPALRLLAGFFSAVLVPGAAVAFPGAAVFLHVSQDYARTHGLGVGDLTFKRLGPRIPVPEGTCVLELGRTQGLWGQLGLGGPQVLGGAPGLEAHMDFGGVWQLPPQPVQIDGPRLLVVLPGCRVKPSALQQKFGSDAQVEFSELPLWRGTKIVRIEGVGSIAFYDRVMNRLVPCGASCSSLAGARVDPTAQGQAERALEEIQDGLDAKTPPAPRQMEVLIEALEGVSEGLSERAQERSRMDFGALSGTMGRLDSEMLSAAAQSFEHALACGESADQGLWETASAHCAGTAQDLHQIGFLQDLPLVFDPADPAVVHLSRIGSSIRMITLEP